jgi:putative membrane protein
VTGFVYFDERLPVGQFFVSRIILSCCAADGFAVAMLVDWTPSAVSLEQDMWVHVTGPVDTAYLADDPEAIPLIKAERVEIIPAPDEPYLYP